MQLFGEFNNGKLCIPKVCTLYTTKITLLFAQHEDYSIMFYTIFIVSSIKWLLIIIQSFAKRIHFLEQTLIVSFE